MGRTVSERKVLDGIPYRLREMNFLASAAGAFNNRTRYFRDEGNGRGASVRLLGHKTEDEKEEQFVFLRGVILRCRTTCHMSIRL